MHISDGVLPISVTIGSYVISAGLVAWSTRRTQSQELPKLAVMTAAFFVASMVHVPFGPTSVHLIIPGLTGAILGPSAFLSIGLGLLLQSLLFQFGGLTALGANALLMGIPAMLCGWFFQQFRGEGRMRQSIVGGVVGGLGSALAAILLSLFLATGGEDFFGVAKMALLAHLPVILIEGGVSGFTIGFLIRVKPALLAPASSLSSKPTEEMNNACV